MNYSNSDNESDHSGAFIALQTKINKDRSSNIKTASQLADELIEIMGKERKYIKLANRLKNYTESSTLPSTKMRNSFAVIERKSRSLRGKVYRFKSMFMAAESERERVEEWLQPLMDIDFDETASLEQLTAQLAKLEEIASAVAEQKPEFQNLWAKWEEMKGGLNAGLDNYIQRIQELMEEKEN